MDSKGQTLYRINKDSMNKSSCSGACAEVWPPLLTTESRAPAAGSGVTALGTINVSGGKQVTDKACRSTPSVPIAALGRSRGQNVTDIWGTWFTVTTHAPAGGTKTTTPATAPATTGGGVGGPTS